MEHPSWYIYALCDPRVDDPVQRVRYVGKSVDPRRRLTEHIRISSKEHNYKANWIRSLQRKGHSPQLDILERGVGSWEEAERKWIWHFRDLGVGLTNKYNGGSGGPYKPPQPGDGCGLRHLANGCWHARLPVNGRRVSIGVFDSHEEASRIRDQCVRDPSFLTVWLADRPNRPTRKNPHKVRPNGSGYRGVHVLKDRSITARIMKDKKPIHLGCFPTVEAAARAYDRKAAELFGPSAILNFREASS